MFCKLFIWGIVMTHKLPNSLAYPSCKPVISSKSPLLSLAGARADAAERFSDGPSERHSRQAASAGAAPQGQPMKQFSPHSTSLFFWVNFQPHASIASLDRVTAWAFPDFLPSRASLHPCLQEDNEVRNSGPHLKCMHVWDANIRRRCVAGVGPVFGG